MPIDRPEPPPVGEHAKAPDAPIADMRDVFARTSPQTEEDRVQARAFIEGKIEMIRRDPQMTPAEKAAAIRDLQNRQ
jgi:hypothetical protein